MPQAFKVLTFQAAALVAGAAMLSTVSVMTKAAPAPAPAQAAVEIGNFTFKARVLTVRPGTTVTWTNHDDAPHIVVARAGVFRSRALDTGDKFSFTFTKAGQFGYFCSLHPQMTGTIVVKA